MTTNCQNVHINYSQGKDLNIFTHTADVITIKMPLDYARILGKKLEDLVAESDMDISEYVKLHPFYNALRVMLMRTKDIQIL